MQHAAATVLGVLDHATESGEGPVAGFVGALVKLFAVRVVDVRVRVTRRGEVGIQAAQRLEGVVSQDADVGLTAVVVRALGRVHRGGFRVRSGTFDQHRLGRGDKALLIVRAHKVVDHGARDARAAAAGFEVERNGRAVGEHATALERARLVASDVLGRVHVLHGTKLVSQ